ncbi:MAG: hypothetical protein ACKPJJ_08635, partial [Planctomycetaceae bacterium]
MEPAPDANGTSFYSNYSAGATLAEHLQQRMLSAVYQPNSHHSSAVAASTAVVAVWLVDCRQ